MKESVIKKILPALHLLKSYHRHEIFGLDNVPLYGKVLVLTNHSLATYDGFLLGFSIYLGTGRMPYGLGDTNLFKLPVFRDYSPMLNMVEANHLNAEKLLSEGEIVCIAPGGMREALRSSEEKRTILWQKRMGFARLAIKTQTPVILAACPKADDIFSVKTNLLTKLIYKKMKLPFVIAHGVGPTLIPKPVKLTHFLSTPIYPPDVQEGDINFKSELAVFHQRIIEEMESLMQRDR